MTLAPCSQVMRAKFHALTLGLLEYYEAIVTLIVTPPSMASLTPPSMAAAIVTPCVTTSIRPPLWDSLYGLLEYEARDALTV